MSENQNRGFSKYNTMSTEELEEILRLDAASAEEDSDTELLLHIMGVLADRKTGITGKTAQESWESFQENYLDEESTEALGQPFFHDVDSLAAFAAQAHNAVDEHIFLIQLGVEGGKGQGLIFVDGHREPP